MKTYYIITNHDKDPSLTQTGRIQKYLEARGGKCYIHDSADRSVGRLYRYTDPDQVPADVECVLVLGGDGTLLHAARDLVDRSLPLMGINLGTLGYLTEVETGSYETAVDALLEGNCFQERRMMLQGKAVRGGKTLLEDIALNDIVISRRGKMRVVDFNILVNDSFLCSYRADGIIVASPTGSTGYSLSAGGPIVSPDARLILITGVAPHTLAARPVVLPENVTVTIEVGGDAGEKDGADVVFDGDTSLTLQVGDRVEITRSDKEARLIKLTHTSFVEIMRRKMN